MTSLVKTVHPLANWLGKRVRFVLLDSNNIANPMPLQGIVYGVDGQNMQLSVLVKTEEMELRVRGSYKLFALL